MVLGGDNRTSRYFLSQRGGWVPVPMPPGDVRLVIPCGGERAESTGGRPLFPGASKSQGDLAGCVLCCLCAFGGRVVSDMLVFVFCEGTVSEDCRASWRGDLVCRHFFSFVPGWTISPPHAHTGSLLFFC